MGVTPERSRREFHAGPCQSSFPIRNRLIPSVNCRTLRLIRRPTGFSVFFSQRLSGKACLTIDRGRKDRLVSAPPPSEPCRRISRTRLSSQWFGLITSKRIDRPVHGPLLSYTALELQRRHSASVDDLNRDHVLCDRCVFGGCFAASSESSRPARKTSSCSCA